MRLSNDERAILRYVVSEVLHSVLNNPAKKQTDPNFIRFEMSMPNRHLSTIININKKLHSEAK